MTLQTVHLQGQPAEHGGGGEYSDRRKSGGSVSPSLAWPSSLRKA